MDQAEMKGTMFWMFIAVALFGYFGLKVPATITTVANPTPQLVPLWAMLKYSLLGGAAGFILALVLTVVMPRIGMLVYGVVGLITAVLFIVCAAWDYFDQQYALAAPVFLLVIFALWNGYSSIDILSRLLLNRDRAPGPGEA